MQKRSQPRHNQLRKGRRSIPGAYYSITISTHKRNPILANAQIANTIFETFDWLETQDRIKWTCIIVIPDHIHTIFQLGYTHSLSNVIKSLKTFTARQINKSLGRSGTFWQSSFHDHVIRKDVSLKTIFAIIMKIPFGVG